jgi:3-hydroxyisobutyrate dehydrogenase
MGFVGLGTMGLPMALNLVNAGAPLLVWNRSSANCRRLAAAGATVARDPLELFTAARS